MTAASKIHRNEASSVLLVNVLEIEVAALLYGLYCIFFARCAFILLQRLRRLERQGILLGAMVTLFLLSSAQLFVLTLNSAMVTGVSSMNGAEIRTASLLIYVTSSICSDALLIYRCYVIWDDIPYVIVPPLILLVNATAFGYAWNITVFQSISLSTVISVTLLTVSKVVWATFQRRAYLSGEQKRKYISATSAILESGALYGIAVSIHFAFFVRGSVAAPVLFAAVGQIVGIAPTLIIVRAGVGATKVSAASITLV
ncbi:hypothetical protein DFH09DRAFT_1323159 [Mycena vulgaris]|nr:hypothetical protein DFH09DRAFT_1323159 [Mycena vulgaris]